MKIRRVVCVICFFVLPFSYSASSNPISLAGVDTQINLNKADLKTLTKSFKGIGVKRAEAIVKYRQEHGKFKSVSELAKVPGFGQKFVTSHLDELQKNFQVK
ncbi:ComEA family DNA-binding protein [Legionella sp. D16C41]|uniref:ComEA family DNA-binding protein n=1 Tax=Legionella sp. D16C41 TaxID=3402688 RepID=UPI003AF42F3A